MDFDFYERYQSLSTAELLIIVKQERMYQADAIDVAKGLLERRQISEDDWAEVDKYFQDVADRQKSKQQTREYAKSVTEDFIESFIKPTSEVDAQKWLYVLLGTLTIQYAWSLYSTLKEAFEFWNCINCRLDFLTLIGYSSIIYVPIIFALLYQKRRWGWILLFADNLFCIISQISQVFIFFKYQSVHNGSSDDFLFPIFLRSLFAYFLWRQDIAAFFSVTLRTKQETGIIVTVLTLVFIASIMTVFS